MCGSGGGSVCSSHSALCQEGAVYAAHIQHFVKRGQCLQLTFSTLSRGGSVCQHFSTLSRGGSVWALCQEGAVCSSHSALCHFVKRGVCSSHSALCQEGAVSAHIQHFVKRGQCLSRGGSVCSSHSALCQEGAVSAAHIQHWVQPVT